MKAIRFSNTAITVVSAAELRNRKNSTPHQRPPGMWLNTFGSEMKTSPGPEPASTP